MCKNIDVDKQLEVSQVNNYLRPGIIQTGQDRCSLGRFRKVEEIEIVPSSMLYEYNFLQVSSPCKVKYTRFATSGSITGMENAC